MQLKCSFLSFASSDVNRNTGSSTVCCLAQHQKVNMVSIKVSFVVIACFSLMHVLVHDAFYLSVFLYWLEHLITFNRSRTPPPPQPSPWGPNQPLVNQDNVPRYIKTTIWDGLSEHDKDSEALTRPPVTNPTNPIKPSLHVIEPWVDYQLHLNLISRKIYCRHPAESTSEQPDTNILSDIVVVVALLVKIKPL